MKYSKISGVTRYSAGTLVLGRGDSFDDDHPLVAERPDIFTDEEPGAKHSHAPRVERATRAPGETRQTGAPAKKATAPKKLSAAQQQVADAAAQIEAARQSQNEGDQP